LVLWKLLRQVRVWAATPPERRAGLLRAPAPAALAALAEARTGAPEIADALDRATAALRDPQGEGLAAALHAVAGWAQGRSAEAALQYAEAAAVVDPGAAERANYAGRLARDGTDHWRAEVWFERGIGLARARGDHVEYIRGHLGYGILLRTLGKVRGARKHFDTASILAKKDGRRWLAAEAQHDLFYLMADASAYAEAERHARRALAWYPKHHPRVPFLAADFAFVLVCRRHHAEAVELLEGFLRAVEAPGEQLLGMSVLVRALACSGRLRDFERLRRRLRKLLAEHDEFEPAARINLAEAERAAGMWEAAEANARTALSLARARREAQPERLAAALLAQVTARVPAPPAELLPADRELQGVVRAFVARLAAWSPRRPGRAPRVCREHWAA
ncbi:MAG TPA: hypothetical protein VFX98_00580, partial [Longimicrobiaceae bacterium]|nr:hypothetical protein [Longimicrobiaceae bacterium]